MKRILQSILIAVLLTGTALAQGTTPPSSQLSISPTWFRTSTIDSNFYAKIGTNTWYRFPTWEKINGIFGNYYSRTVSDARFIKQSDSVLKYVTPRRLLDTARTKQSYQNVIYHKAFWSNLTDFTVSGTAPTITATNSLLLTNTRLLVTEANSNDPLTDIKIKFVLASTSTSGVISVGRTTQVGGYSNYATWNPLTNVLSTNLNSVTNTVNSINVPFANNVGDIMELSFSQRGPRVIATLTNISYDQTSTISFNGFELNRGMMTVWSTTGTSVNVQDIRVTSLSPRNPNIMFCGDSKTTLPLDANYPKYMDDYGPVAVFAGPSERATQLAGLAPYIIKYIKPEGILLNIGRNDEFAGTAPATWQAAYITFVNQMTAAGIKVYHMLPIPETAFTGQAPVAAFINATYAAADIIDPSVGWDNAKYLQVDGIHPNEAGARFLANLVKGTGKFTKRSFIQPDNDLKSFLLSDAVNAGKTIGANTTGNSATTTAVSGTTNRIAKFTSSSTIANSLIYENGINIGFGTASPAKMLDVEKDDDYQMRLGNGSGQYYDFGRDLSTGYLAIYGSQSGFNGYIFKGVDRTFLTINNSGDANFSTGKLTVFGAPTNPTDVVRKTELDLKAPLASPALTGVPTVPTAAFNTSTTQAASTAMVQAAIAGGTAGAATNWAVTPVSDFNTPTGFKLLRASGATVANQPGTPGNYGSGIQFDTNGFTDYTNQLVFSINGELYTRTRAGGAFSSWDRVTTASQIVGLAPLASPTFTGTATTPALNISTAPTTSAGTYDLLTRNASTGVVEKIAPSALGNQVVEITGTSQTGTVNTINIPHNAALTTITAPSATVVGSLFQVVGEGAGGWKITLPAGYIAKGVGVSTSTAGSIASTDRYCTITLRLAAANTFVITSSQGTLNPL